MTGMTPAGARLRARLRTAVLMSAVALGSAACGLQQTGIDGALSATRAGGDTTYLGTTDPGSAPGVDPVTGQVLSGAQGSAPGTGTVSGGTGTTGTTGTGTGTGSGTGSGSGTGTGGSPQTPGLKGTLTVSYINVTGFDQLSQVVVIKTASTGDARAQVNAMTNYINSHGGIAGRKLVGVVHDYNAQQASEVNDNNLCQAITTTDKAFMAVLHGQIHYSARDCYAAKKTLAFEGSAYGFGHNFYSGHAPYLWSPSYPDYDQTSRALVKTLVERKWLAGQSKVGLVLWDDKPYHEVADDVLIPLLKKAGVDTVKASISNADIGSIEGGIHAAAQTLIANNVTHVLFLGSAPLQPFFVQQNQQYSQFRYGLTTFDVPRYMAVNFPRNMTGAVGVGFSPADDVLDAQYKFPQPGMETFCRDLYTKAGVQIAGRYVVDVFNSKQAMSYCESTMLLKQVADTIPSSLTAANWTAAAQKLGTRFQAAQTFRTSFSSAKHTGAAAYRDVLYDPKCSCMVYATGNRSFP